MSAEQQTLFATPPSDPMQRALSCLRRDPLGFKSVTEGWLLANESVWLAFWNRTERLRATGRTHYGAKAIAEVVRYDTAIRDAEITFKLNNNYTSGLARLYNEVAGVDFFETREQIPA